MQIVIEMPEDEYKAIVNKYGTFPAEWKKWGLAAIKNGTPIPEDCGRLIDADKYRRMWVDTFDSCYGDECAKLFKASVDNAQTIIGGRT